MEILKRFTGELELIGRKGDEVIYYDKGFNTVTIWAKQATMHLLTGEVFSSHGEQRLFDGEGAQDHTEGASKGEGVNPDGTLISGQQFFTDNTSPDFSIETRWSKSTINANTALGDSSDTDSEVKYPFFPTKMLFGTGFEYVNWSSIPSAYQQYYTSLGWTQSMFDSNISTSDNDYSNEFSGSSLVQKRTMNDIYASPLTQTVDDNSFGVAGAIKNGTYTESSTERNVKTYFDGGQEYLIREWQGIGRPSFVYARRESRYFQSGSEIQLSADSNIENKITFSVVLPEQTGTQAGVFYPYNGYTIKVAGLFCDSRYILFNTNPDTSPANIDHTNELNNYRRMPYGMMYAKRNVAPFTKTPEVSLTARWTLYL